MTDQERYEQVREVIENLLGKYETWNRGCGELFTKKMLLDQILQIEGIEITSDDQSIICGYASLAAARHSMKVTCPAIEAGFKKMIKRTFKELRNGYSSSTI